MARVLGSTSIRRQITGHEVPGESRPLRVLAVDAPGDGGASHQYRIERDDGSQVGFVNFHRIVDKDGDMHAVFDANGVSHESLLSVIIDRLEGFQTGEFACKENEVALKKLREAMASLQARTKKRIERKVEGTMSA